MSADPWAPTGVRDETIQQAPIYARLVTIWHQSGRTVPGRRDHEWSRLVTPPRFSAHPAPARERFAPHPPPDPGPDGPNGLGGPDGPSGPEPGPATVGAAPPPPPATPFAAPSVAPSVVRPREAQ